MPCSPRLTATLEVSCMHTVSLNILPRHSILRDAVRRFDNLDSEDVKQLAVITLAIMGPAYFHEDAEVIGAAGDPPDRARMMDVFRRHGMTVAAPPPTK